ncbi:dihydrofolate reductase family protein [Nocardia farcinica]|uniref:dihydrofolate reductase family protein n=1 Tax=Nocardia farcinica TaxID=37329 RepID=UPI0024552237|nr:dihydrofolate reductase family protein [Nocardia farcinica]
MSLDGHLDDVGPERLRLSDAADFDRVDRVRAESDAILVGAQTLRRDDPRPRVAPPAPRAPPGRAPPAPAPPPPGAPRRPGRGRQARTSAESHRHRDRTAGRRAAGVAPGRRETRLHHRGRRRRAR